MKPTPKEVKVSKKTTSNQDLADEYSQNLLVAIEVVKACQRHYGPPLLWFYSDYEYLSDAKDSVKEWMKGRNKKVCGKDLVTDQRCVAGYEADFVIYLGSNKDFMFASMSRCRGQFVHIE